MSTAAKSPHIVIAPYAARLVEALRPYCHRIEIAGSLRRQCPQVGDIELVAIPKRSLNLFAEPIDGPTALDRFLDEQGVAFAKRGERYQQFAYGRHTVDLFLPTADTWGSTFTIRTGSWEFSRWLVTDQPRGAKPWAVQFRDGRLYADGRLLSTPEESDVFAALGLVYIPPAFRIGPVAVPLRIEPIWKYEEPQ